MAKRLKSAVDWIPPLAILVIACLVVYFSETFQACIQQSNEGGAGKDAEEGVRAVTVVVDHYRRCLGDFLHEYGETVIAAFTIILGFATWFLWRATRNLVLGAERTAERQLRAYVGIDTVSITQVAAGQKPHARLSVKNYGQTPAYQLRNWTEAILASPDHKAFVIPSSKPVGTKPLDPGASFSLHSEYETALTAEEASQVTSGERRIYFFGEMEYFDAFAARRTTKFRYMYGGPQFVQLGSFMGICDEGNEST